MANDLDDLLAQMTTRLLELGQRVDELERQEAGMQTTGPGGIIPTVFPFGELNAEAREDDVSVQFQYPYYNTEFDLKPAVIVGSAAATVTDGYLLLNATGGSVIVESKNAVRYRPGHSGYAQFTASFVGDGTGYAGVWAVDEDGFYLKIVDGEPFIGFAKSGVENNTGATGGFFPGGEINIGAIDFEKVNIFRIMFGYLGVANPAWQIKIGGRWQLLGTLQTEGLRTTSHIDNPVLPIGFKASGTMAIRTISWNAGKLGDGDQVGARFFASDLTATLNGTNLATLGTFRNRATFQAQTNRVKAKLLRYHFFVDAPATGTGTVQIRIIKNATTAGVPSWTNTDTNNSIMEFDAVATYSSGGRILFTEWLGYSSAAGASAAKSGGEVSEAADNFGLFLLPNETATITAQNVAGTTNVGVRVAFNWIELF
jgi:hypothetical protein